MAPKPKRVGVQILSELPEFLDLELDLIQANARQPRTNLDEPGARQRIESLAESIASYGLQQPILVRRLACPTGDAVFEIVAGERRYRAHKHLGRATIPALIMADTGNSETNAEIISLVENLQRENIDSLDLAHAVRKLVDGGATLATVGKIIGMTEGNVSRILSVLKLPPTILADYKTGTFKVDGDAEVRQVADVVTGTALSELSRVARDGSLDEVGLADLWAQIRTGEIRKGGIREAARNVVATQPEPVDQAPVSRPRTDPTERTFHVITSGLGKLAKRATLSDAERARLRDLRKIIDDLLSK